MGGELSEVLREMLKSAQTTAADSNMHADLRIGRNGLVIRVNSAKNTSEGVVPWSEIDRSDDLSVLISDETLVQVEKVKRMP